MVWAQIDWDIYFVIPPCINLAQDLKSDSNLYRFENGADSGSKESYYIHNHIHCWHCCCILHSRDWCLTFSLQWFNRERTIAPYRVLLNVCRKFWNNFSSFMLSNLTQEISELVGLKLVGQPNCFHDSKLLYLYVFHSCGLYGNLLMDHMLYQFLYLYKKNFLCFILGLQREGSLCPGVCCVF